MVAFLITLPLGLMTNSTALPVSRALVFETECRHVDVAVGPDGQTLDAALHARRDVGSTVKTSTGPRSQARAGSM